MTWENISAWFASVDWGTAPEWFGAIGTIGAVAVALTFGLRDGKRLDDELVASANDREEAATDRAAATKEREESASDRANYRRERSELADERLHELARRVSFSIHENSDPDPIFNPDFRLVIRVGNHGPYPVNNVRLHLDKPDLDADADLLANWHTIVPGESVLHGLEYESDALNRLRQVFLHFQDARGRSWTTDLQGRLL